MAYTKQTWTDDVSAVTEARMTHIEQGIYDNSLATDKINPSGTATTTAEIEEGQISDVIGFKSLKLKGQTSQETTQGNNLLNIYTRHPAGYTETVSGVTFTYNNDGSINANGTATADINYFIASKGQLGDDIFNGTNYLSGCTGGSLTTFYLQFWADTIGTYPQATTEVATSKTADVNWNITIGIKNGVTIDKTFYPMMSATSGKTFEKYSGGKASPNPDFPQDIRTSEGYNKLNLINKNMFNFKSSTTQTGTAERTTDETGFILRKGTNRTNNWRCAFPPGTYTVQFDLTLEGSTMSTQNFGFTPKKENQENITGGNLFTGSGTKRYTFTATSDVGFLYFFINNSESSNCVATISNLMVLRGTYTSNTSYVAYQEKDYEIDLPVENLFFLPNATITNGIEYTINNDGTFNVYGTASANTTISLTKDLELTKIKETTYTFSVNQTLPVGVEIRIEGFNGNTWKRHLGGSPLNSSNSIKNGTADLTDVNKVRTAIYVHSGISVNMKNVAVQFEKGSVINSFTPYGTNPIELFKIGTAQDYIYRKNGRWYVYRAIRRAILDGTNNYAANKSSTTNNTLYVTSNISNIKPVANNGVLGNIMSSHFKAYTTDQLFSGTQAVGISKRDGSEISLAFGLDTELTTKELVNAWLAEVKPVIYYEVLTPIDEEITYAPLLRQLDELYNSGLYDVTNISQDNSSEAFVLDIEACKNNINGIVEYIRR